MRSVQDAGTARVQRSRVLACFDSLTGGFYADQLHFGIVGKGMEEANSVTAPAHAGDSVIRQTSLQLENLRSRFDADDRLQIAYNHRVRRGTSRSTKEIIGRLNVGHPV